MLDEMNVKESLVFDKHEIKVVGFVDMGDVNNELADLEGECSTTEQHPAIATHMLYSWYKEYSLACASYMLTSPPYTLKLSSFLILCGRLLKDLNI